jgi:phage shock protein PspC (stress-responsive transcriptional regulator)
VLFGVAGGMADWLDVDPSVVRLVWAILVLFGGAGLLLYIIAALVIPEEPYDLAAPAAAPGMGTAGPPADASAPGAPAVAPDQGGWADARAARRAARAARRAERGNSAGIVFGVILILIGGWFLLRNVVPGLDDRWLWPGILVLVGLLLVAAAIRRQSPPS